MTGWTDRRNTAQELKLDRGAGGCVFVYNAFDRADGPPNYTGEALVSARSLRRHTDKPIRLSTNNAAFAKWLETRADNPFTDAVVVPDGVLPKAAKIACIKTYGGSDTVFLDCDTFILADISRVFEFGPFDLAARPERARTKIDSIEAAIPRESLQKYALNSGVLFVRGDFAERFSDQWLWDFEHSVNRNSPRVMDQRSLRSALKRLGADVMLLADNYNFRAGEGGQLGGACFVVHTHYRDDLQALAEADFPPEQMDRLIDHVATINATLKQTLMRGYDTHSLYDVTFERKAQKRAGKAQPNKPAGQLTRLSRALRNP